MDSNSLTLRSAREGGLRQLADTTWFNAVCYNDGDMTAMPSVMIQWRVRSCAGTVP